MMKTRRTRKRRRTRMMTWRILPLVVEVLIVDPKM